MKQICKGALMKSLAKHQIDYERDKWEDCFHLAEYISKYFVEGICYQPT